MLFDAFNFVNRELKFIKIKFYKFKTCFIFILHVFVKISNFFLNFLKNQEDFIKVCEKTHTFNTCYIK